MAEQSARLETQANELATLREANVRAVAEKTHAEESAVRAGAEKEGLEEALRRSEENASQAQQRCTALEAQLTDQSRRQRLAVLASLDTRKSEAESRTLQLERERSQLVEMVGEGKLRHQILQAQADAAARSEAEIERQTTLNFERQESALRQMLRQQEERYEQALQLGLQGLQREQIGRQQQEEQALQQQLQLLRDEQVYCSNVCVTAAAAVAARRAGRALHVRYAYGTHTASCSCCATNRWQQCANRVRTHTGQALSGPS